MAGLRRFRDYGGHTVADKNIKKLLPAEAARILSDAADVRYGYRVHAEYEIWQYYEYVEGVIYDSSTGAGIGDIASGPFPVNPSVRPTDEYENPPSGNTYREVIWQVCFLGDCETFGAKDMTWD